MQLTQSFSIVERLPEASTAIISIYSPSTTQVAEETVGYSGLLESLRLYSEINSLDDPGIPTDIDNLGDVEALESFKNFQWSSPRLHLNIMRRKGNSSWQMIGKTSLIGRKPFYQVDLMKYLTRQVVYRMAAGDSLGLQIEDAGFGLLTNIDNLTVFGEGLEEADLVLPADQDVIGLSATVGSLQTAVASIQAATASIAQSVDAIRSSGYVFGGDGGGDDGQQPGQFPNADSSVGSAVVDNGAAVVDGNFAVVELN